MDTYKEIQVAMYGDKFLQRGFAVLAVDGPGQSEAVAGGLLLTPRNFADAGSVWLDWIATRPDLDPNRVGVYARSFGSYAATVLASEHAERLRAVCVALVIHEPGLYSLMETSTPSYKARFMYMTGHKNEEEFDRYVTGFDVREHAELISCPYLVVAGQLDELSPIEHTYRLLDTVPHPKELVVYEGERHAIGRGPASRNGPHWHSLAADWLRRRVIDEQPAQSKSLLVKRSGDVVLDPRGFND
jgi:dipeptidyl aminopeptidase/acylaminoacyl peptidase